MNPKVFHIKKNENEADIKYYINNLTRITNNHFKKYNEYIKNFNKKEKVTYNHTESYTFKDKITEFSIVTEDMSVDYNMYNNNGKMEYITPFHIKEFRDILRNNLHVKHCFHLVYDSNETEVMYYFHNAIDNLEELDEIMNYKSPSKIIKANVFIWKGKND